MILNAIFACDINNGIGKNGDLPWPRHKEDMKWFKEWTSGGIVIMGRKTWESIGSKPLKNRYNVVLSSKVSTENGPDYIFATDLNETLEYFSTLNQSVWIMGGGAIYEQAIPLCDAIYMTRFKQSYDCDTFISKELLKPFQRLNHSEDREDCSFTVWSKS